MSDNNSSAVDIDIYRFLFKVHRIRAKLVDPTRPGYKVLLDWMADPPVYLLCNFFFFFFFFLT
jgi:hypothetical protein